MNIPKLQTWAVSKYDLEDAWFRYTRTKEFPQCGSGEDYLIWCAFESAFAYGWLRGKNLDPDYNVVEFV
jgi:hypothetical protein